MSINREELLIELDGLFHALDEFNDNIGGVLSEDQLKYSDRNRRRVKKIMTTLYEGYYPSMGGHSKANYVFMFNNLQDAKLFSDEIMKVTKKYKRFFLEQLNEINVKVTLNKFKSDEEFYEVVDKMIFD